MKTVFSNKQETAHAWAARNQDQGREGSNSRIYFQGDTIYSFGRHFPIATFYDRKKRGKPAETVVLMTTCSYSHTTSAHKQAVRSAASHYNFIYCKDPIEASEGRHGANMANFESQAHDIALKLPRSTKPEKYLSSIRYIRNEAKEYATFFGLNVRSRKFGFKYLFIESKEAGKKATDKEIKEMNKLVADRAAREVENCRDSERKFREFELDCLDASNHYLGFDNKYTLLRVNEINSRIETSKRIGIPFEKARPIYDQLMALREIAKEGVFKPTERLEERVEIFGHRLISISPEEFRVGCHTITFSEMKAVALKMGWINDGKIEQYTKDKQ